MKKVFLFAALSGLLLTACNSEVTNPQVDPFVTPASESLSVTFRVNGPARGPVTYAQYQNEDEYRIKRLDVLALEKDGSIWKLKADGIYSWISTGGTSQKIQLTPATTGGTTAPELDFELTLDPTKDLGKTYKFLLIANGDTKTLAEAFSNIDVGKSEEEIWKRLTSTVDGSVRVHTGAGEKFSDGLLMTGASGEVPLNETGNDAGTITLTRVVARIDLGLNPRAGDEITVTKAYIKDVPAKSYLGLQEGKTPSAATEFVTYKEVENPVFGDPRLAQVGKMKKVSERVFYVYEIDHSQYATLKKPVMHIEGTYKISGTSTPVVIATDIEVPATLDIKRNHIYTFVLGVEPDPNAYTFILRDVHVLKWEDLQTVEQSVGVITVGKLDPATNTMGDKSVAGVWSYDAAHHILTLDKKDAVEESSGAELDVRSSFLNDTNKMKLLKEHADPATGGTATPNNSWIHGKTLEGSLKLWFDENKTGAQREGVIWLKSDKDLGSSCLHKIKVVQPGA